jgi:AcrR family transcriptional regulator
MTSPSPALAASRIDAAPPRRRPADGGYARGEETRARIVEAAMKVFAAEGFARASTRRIAAEAGVNPPALQYYFDSKEGLHRACGDLIIDHCRATLDPAREDAEAALAEGSPEEALEGVCRFLDVLAKLSVTSRETPVWSHFMNRAQMDDGGPAYRHVKATLAEPMHGLLARLVGRVIGQSAEDEEVKLRALILSSQISGLHRDRENVLAELGWPDFGGPRLALVTRIAREHTRAALLALRAEPSQPDASAAHLA